MKRYYGIIDDCGILSETGTSKRKLLSMRKEVGEEAFVVNLTEEVFQYAREIRNEEPLSIEELWEEYDSRIDDTIYYLNLRHLTIGDLKKAFAGLPDDTEIFVWDTDSRASKGCVEFFINGPTLTLETETWGRSHLKH